MFVSWGSFGAPLEASWAVLEASRDVQERLGNLFGRLHMSKMGDSNKPRKYEQKLKDFASWGSFGMPLKASSAVLEVSGAVLEVSGAVLERPGRL